MSITSGGGNTWTPGSPGVHRVTTIRLHCVTKVAYSSFQFSRLNAPIVWELLQENTVEFIILQRNFIHTNITFGDCDLEFGVQINDVVDIAEVDPKIFRLLKIFPLFNYTQKSYIFTNLSTTETTKIVMLSYLTVCVQCRQIWRPFQLQETIVVFKNVEEKLCMSPLMRF